MQGWEHDQGWVSPLLNQRVGAASLAIPGAVGVPAQAAVGAGLAIELTAMQGELDQPMGIAHK